MVKDIYEIMLNPIRMRIVQAFASRNSMTANEICEVISDVPRTTLYRHINILIEANIVIITEEKKIRGSLERTLALNTNELSKPSNAEDIPKQVLKFLMGTYAKFDAYFNKANSAPSSNTIFFNNTVLMMTDQEFDTFLSELQELFVKYHHDAADNRKPRDITVISAPTTGADDEE